MTAPEADILDGVDATLFGLARFAPGSPALATGARGARRAACGGPRPRSVPLRPPPPFRRSPRRSRLSRGPCGARRVVPTPGASRDRRPAPGRRGRRGVRAGARAGSGAGGSRRRRPRHARPVAGCRGGPLQQRAAAGRGRGARASGAARLDRRAPRGRRDRTARRGRVAARPLRGHGGAGRAAHAALLAPPAGSRPPRASRRGRRDAALEPAARDRARPASRGRRADQRPRAGRLALRRPLRRRREAARAHGRAGALAAAHARGRGDSARGARKALEVRASVRSFSKSAAPAELRLEAPAGFTVEPPSVRLDVRGRGRGGGRALPGHAARRPSRGLAGAARGGDARRPRAPRLRPGDRLRPRRAPPAAAAGRDAPRRARRAHDGPGSRWAT